MTIHYCSKIKEKEGSIRRWELFSSSLHVTPNVPTIKLSDSLIYKKLFYGVVKI